MLFILISEHLSLMLFAKGLRYLVENVKWYHCFLIKYCDNYFIGYLDQGIDKSPDQLPPHPSSSPDGAGLAVLPSARRVPSAII